MRTWEKPIAVVDQFVANSFVSTCGDKNTVYNFECNAGDTDKKYDVITEDGRNLTKDSFFILGKRYYHPCNETHQASTTDDFIKGYMVDDNGVDVKIWSSKKTPVIIWTDNGTNVHCTTNLDMKTWTTAKS